MTRTILSNLTLVVVFTALILSACQQQMVPPPVVPQNDGPREPVSQEAFEGLKKFESTSELRAYLAQSTQAGNGLTGGFKTMSRSMGDMAMMESDAVPAPSAGGSADGAEEYSTTNVQVAGVDEADFIKNDNQFIYAITQDKLSIVKAYPAEDMEVVFEKQIEGQPLNLFLEGDKLAVLTSVYKETTRVDRYSFVPQPYYEQLTKVLIYDITNREDPKLLQDFSVEGYYQHARLLDGFGYLVTQKDVWSYTDIEPPILRTQQSTIVPDVFYPDIILPSYQFSTITSFAMNQEKIESKTLLLGYGTTLYMSQQNMYLAYQNQQYWRNWEKTQLDRFTKAVYPILPSEYQRQIDSALAQIDDDSTEEDQWDAIMDVLDAMYADLGKDGIDMANDIQDALDEYDSTLQMEQDTTVIQRIAIKDGSITPEAQGKVDGHLLNQFSLDEHEGFLRVATTRSIWTREESLMHNNVFVLDSDMDVVGSLVGLAKDESIYSTRFMGDRLYMVTFQRVDPLFVIDLSDPENPNVLGELKIPGYSDYLHPYDENHLIGIGKQTKENEWGGISTEGVKISLFDVSDVKNPKQVDALEIGQPGSDSEALRDHKAFLFDKSRSLLVIPVREITQRYARNNWPYYQKVWQGAYVLTVNTEGISVRGKIAHFEGDEEENWYWSSPHAISRSLFMDDVLYTISQYKILASDVEKPETELGEIALPYKVENYPVPYYGRDMVGIASAGTASSESAVVTPEKEG